MTTIQSAKDIKESKLSTKVSIFAMFLLPFAGVGCLIFPTFVEEFLPWLLGAPMVFSGVGNIVAVVRERKADAGKKTMGSAIVMCILGLIIILHGTDNTLFIGTIWGLLGLVKAAGEFDDIFHSIRIKEPFALSLSVCIFELVLAILLILNPLANLEHHLILLGIQLIIYPFKLHREHGKLKIEAEA